MAEQFILDRPLFTDKDKKLVLEEGDPKAAFLIGGKGTPIDDADVEKYGLDDSHRQKEEEKTEEARVLTTDDIEVSSPVEEGAEAVASKKVDEGSKKAPARKK